MREDKRNGKTVSRWPRMSKGLEPPPGEAHSPRSKSDLPEAAPLSIIVPMGRLLGVCGDADMEVDDDVVGMLSDCCCC